MENTLSVAKELFGMYKVLNGSSMDEMKMHKLMYFTQRESLMLKNEALFDELFYGWKYGPVLKSVHNEYRKMSLFGDVTGQVSEETKELLKSVMERYGNMSSWTLSKLSHNEFSWKAARKGLKAGENGDVALSLDAMRLDAVMESMRRAEPVNA